MGIYKNLLVPLDGSKLGEISFPFAKELAAKLNLPITFLYVATSGERQFGQMHRAYVEWTADAITRQSEKEGWPIVARGEVVVSGSASEGILDYARKNKIELIFMVTRRCLEPGSVSDSILRTSQIPVFLVRADSTTRVSSGKRSNMSIIVPLDGSILAESILPHVEAIAKSRGSGTIDVILVRVCEAPAINSDYPESMAVSWDKHVDQEVAKCQVDSKQYLSGIERRLRQSGIKVKQQTLVGRVADEIVDFAAKTPSSLIAMSTHGRSGVGRWVYGSVAEKVLTGASSPILLVRPQK